MKENLKTSLQVVGVSMAIAAAVLIFIFVMLLSAVAAVSVATKWFPSLDDQTTVEVQVK